MSSRKIRNNQDQQSYSHRVFSVDDDPREVQDDIRYLESLQDGARYPFKTKSSKNSLNIATSNTFSPIPDDENLIHTNANEVINAPSNPDLKNSIKNTISPMQSRPNLKIHPSGNRSSSKVPVISTPDFIQAELPSSPAECDRFLTHNGSPRLNSNNELLLGELNPEDTRFSVDNDLENEPDNASTTSSLASYTLRVRQDAINKTHPFGIRIWKPALYKKQRSVQKAAAEDIHETKLKTITPLVHISNVIWAMTCGVLLYVLFAAAGSLVVVLGLFTKSSREYSIVFLRMAKYLLWPFGKVVFLNSDEHYLQEDKDEGITVQQFYKWVTSYSNRLFFHQSQTLIPDSPNSNNGLHHPSYGSIQEYMTNQERTNFAGNSSEQQESGFQQRRYFGRGEWTIGRFLFYILFHLIVEPLVLLLALLTWLIVFTIPMSNILWNLMYHCRRHPLALGFKHIRNTNKNKNISSSINNTGDLSCNNKITTITSDTDDTDDTRNILLCTFRAAGWHYYKFTVDGTNVIVVNLILLVFFTILDFYLLKHFWGIDVWFTNESTIFILCLASIVPLAFYIGQAVASISAQTSMGLGAAINAFFSTVVEVFLYCVALKQSKGLLVEGSMIGSILGAVLLLPGLSMCGGALYRKTQRYNPASAGVNSALLIFSMIVMFVPTTIYEIHGDYKVVCGDEQTVNSVNISTVFKTLSSQECSFTRPPLTHNKLFTNIIQPMSVSCAVVLFMAYAIGLWFTLRTHAKMIWQLPLIEQPKESVMTVEDNSLDLHPISTHVNGVTVNEEDDSNGGHDAPNWSRAKSTQILLLATLLYAVIAEILVSCVDSVLEDIPSIKPKFLGLTIFALVPNTTEFLNAISFAMHGNVALSMEIGSAYALQVCLLQLPALVLFSIFYTWNMIPENIDIRMQMFPLVFPRWDLIATVSSIFIFTYLYAEGKSNYFKGSVLILMYFILILGFFLQDVME
ncbi:hypothetical protein KAFR_0A08540 [Kazachstania africana CBS 2517]|uniref:Sodium/calcium exchanger membrane region domain-containing protein n=1 Tax=Kazachstania africana (strain ATCC 22294 / BCRC 22015 / CBS 2517 / CECT 1963 / NBRC 1671 / NRRL Y-8276) TaxID=1071382 RepID=H2API8_KAZAF|nr:hypothetical protein KAFR_0A08540 [Kazachstania africana CBS 2517]CCF56288.1 hypothetical protein KAFR_0A08540 [Kazachstania africana CBS 2517]